MTYEELKEMGFSDEVIASRGIRVPNKFKYTAAQCAEAWKIGKALAEKGYDFTLEQINTFKEMMGCYEKHHGNRLPYVKGLDR